MIISRTPFRISFFGGGTDYPIWYRQHGGSVLGGTIDKYCYLTCRYLPPFFAHRYRIVYSKVEVCQSVDQICHPAVRAVLNYLEISRGLEIHHDGDLPARSGMGSSSAFTVGLLNALHALEGRMPGKPELARQSIHVEQELLQETVGSQDQVLAAYGGLNLVEFQQSGEICVRPLPLLRPRVEELEQHLMLFYTGIARTASDVAHSYMADVGSRQRQLLALGDLVEAGREILLEDRPLTEFGRLLDRAWQLKRSLSPQVSNDSIEGIYQTALESGATGGKLLGAGGGGFLLLFVPPESQSRVRQALAHLIQVPFRFESHGSQVIFCDRENDYSQLDSPSATRSVWAESTG